MPQPLLYASLTGPIVDFCVNVINDLVVTAIVGLVVYWLVKRPQGGAPGEDELGPEGTRAPAATPGA
ncbi:MAG: hypothetical protein H0X42_05060 [Solirubrobacterales bacterium]|nr:hypothetical protein [Solirubrobacterales bacterium]